jgi:hypothetical protein
MALLYYPSFRLSKVASVHIASDNRDCTVHVWEGQSLLRQEFYGLFTLYILILSLKPST